MRTIKFRAWDELNQEIVYEKFGIFSGGKSSWEILKLYESVMQFTGLHDINGKEIYEGDIIKGEIRNFTVKFEEGMFTTDVGKYLMNGDYEIIGNVFENPDLIKL